VATFLQSAKYQFAVSNRNEHIPVKQQALLINLTNNYDL